ncbi:response regulator [Spirosoma areae]
MNQLYILLADDDEDDCLFFKEALDELIIAAHLTIVPNGEQLMHLLKKSADQLPHVLFLDLNMPRKSGYECLLEIKRDSTLKQLPVIILSTSFEPTVADLLYKNGAQHCIRKPADFSKLKQIIHQALTLVAQENGSQPAKQDFVLNNDLS